MKHQGSNFELADERNDDLMRAYCRLLAGQQVIRRSAVFRQLVAMPSRRFWVTEMQVAALHRGDTLADMLPQKRAMYAEIHSRAVALQASRPDLTLSQAVAIVVQQPAPAFYLTPQSARIIYYRVKKKWFAKHSPRRAHHHG